MTLRPITELAADDLIELAQWLPETVHQLMDCIGTAATLKLLNRWPGVQITIPKHANANAAGARRWAQIADIVGEAATGLIAAEYGGCVLTIPTCSAARTVKRHRAIRRDFDLLTARHPAGQGLSKAEAIQEIGLRYAPISSRQIENILDKAEVAPRMVQSLV